MSAPPTSAARRALAARFSAMGRSSPMGLKPVSAKRRDAATMGGNAGGGDGDGVGVGDRDGDGEDGDGEDGDRDGDGESFAAGTLPSGRV
jgi:hypothetical protein